MTDDEFAAFCAEHPDLNFEMTADGELIVMAPTFPLPAPVTSISRFNLEFGLKRTAGVSAAIPQRDLS